MTRWLIPALTCLAFAACGTSDDKAGEAPVVGGFTLTSTAVQDQASIAPQFTCDGAGQPPPLSWIGPPKGTRSFALILDDPDAPGGTFRHWGAYDIPARARSLPTGGFAQAVNDFGHSGYGGPCPPKGHGRHHYRFKLYALDVDSLGLSAGASVADVEQAAGKHVLARALLTATYERR